MISNKLSYDLLVVVLLFCFTFTSLPQHADAVSNAVGGWSPFSVLATTCSKTCGGGQFKRIRKCSNRTPQGSGKLCEKKDGTRAMYEEGLFACNTHVCWDNAYSNWTNCTKDCGRGKESRYKLCDDKKCDAVLDPDEFRDCNTWNRTACPSPCLTVKCPEYGVCKDKSTEEDPLHECVCVMGYEMNKAKSACIRPPPTTPTPRPIPTLPAAQKTVATVVSKTASTVLLIFVGITLILFLVLRIFTPERIIQMNMEIALFMAHVCLMFPSTITEQVTLCRLVSIFNHFFFTACYMFMLLEALHMYSLVAYVVKKDGFFSRAQNTLIGWGVSAFIVLSSMCFEYDNYGGEYHCWLQMNTSLVYAQFIPVITLVILIFTVIEAAGAADYKPLKGYDREQRFSARIMQRTNLIILPMVFAHWLVGMLSEYEQNLALYGTFSILNGLTGFLVFFLHCTGNAQVQAKLKGCYHSMCKSGASSSH